MLSRFDRALARSFSRSITATVKNLIETWRSGWSAEAGTTDATFPFGLVSLAGGTSEGHAPNMGAFRFAQTGNTGVLPNYKLPGTFAAQAFDTGDPCSGGWFGVKCSADGKHVMQLFPNTRYSGNVLDCVLPSSIGAFEKLEHLYTSNDRTPSSLHGAIPTEVGKLKALKCMYFSHNRLNGSIPTELEQLSELQVFLMRCNQLSGKLIDFSKLPKLRNVWFDTNSGLTGGLDGLGELTGLTFLQASNNPGIVGPLPASLCGIECDALGTGVTCAAALPEGCCGIASCGTGKPAAPPPPSSMGECFPQ